MDSINFNQIINSLIDERMEKEKDNIQDPEYYEKLKNVIEDEKKALVDKKQNEFENQADYKLSACSSPLMWKCKHSFCNRDCRSRD